MPSTRASTPRLQPLEGGVRLPAGEVFLGDGLVEAPPGLGEDRLLQAVDGLPLRPRRRPRATGRPRGGSAAPGRSARGSVRGRREMVAEPMPLVAVEAAEKTGPKNGGSSPDSMRARSSSACSLRSALLESGVDLVDGGGASGVLELLGRFRGAGRASRRTTRRSRSATPRPRAPPPATARPAAVAARIFLHETFMHALLSVDGRGLGRAASERHRRFGFGRRGRR